MRIGGLIVMAVKAKQGVEILGRSEMHGMGWEGSVKSGVGDPRENESWMIVMVKSVGGCFC